MGDRSNPNVPGVATSPGERLESACRPGNDAPEGSQSKSSVAANVSEDQNAQDWNLSPRSTLSRTAVDWKWNRDEAAVKADAGGVGFSGHSFRSEDSDALALWEEKERSPKVSASVSTDLSWLSKPAGSQSPWLGTVSNAVRKMEMLSYAWAGKSVVDSKVGSGLDGPLPSLEYLKRAGGKSSWKDFKIVSTPVKSSEALLRVPAKAKYGHKSSSRRPDGTELPFSGPIASTPPVDAESPSKLRHSVSCELLMGASSTVDMSRPTEAGDESEPSDSNRAKGVIDIVDADNVVPETSAFAAGEAISRPNGKKSFFKERSSASRRSHSMNEAMLMDCASEQAQGGTSRTHDSKASQRYYDARVAPRRKKSSCWNSFDDACSRHHSIDFVAPSAARFLEDKSGSMSPVGMPIKTPGAVPFKWEKEPGKPKESDSDATTTTATSGQLSIVLPLPPRLSGSNHQLCPSVSSASSQYQCPSPLRSPCGNATMSGSLREFHALQNPRCPSSDSPHKVLLPWFSSSFGNTSYFRSASTERPDHPSCTASAATSREFAPRRKSRSVGEVPQRFTTSGEHQPHNIPSGSSTNFAQHQHKPAHPPGAVRPPSPTSILCGPDAGGRLSSSNDPRSLSSEHEATTRNSATAASSQSNLPTGLISFDSVEHRRIRSSGNSTSEPLIPVASGDLTTSPFRATFRSSCSSVSYNPDFEEMRKHLSSTDYHNQAGPHGVSAFVKFCKIGKRWMRTKSHAKLVGSTYPAHPDLYTPSFANSSDFSARLSPEGSNHPTEGYFVPFASAPVHEDLGNRSPVYLATLGLLPKKKKKKKKNRQTKPPLTPWKSTRGLRTRASLRARFLIPIRRSLRTLLTRCTFRLRNKSVIAEPKLLYQYHLHHRSH